MTQAQKIELVLFRIRRANIHLQNIAKNGDQASKECALDALNILSGALDIGSDRPSANGLYSLGSQAVSQ